MENSCIIAILLSAVFLGLNDITKKHAVSKNASMTVLFLGTLVGSLVYAIASISINGIQVVQCSSRDFLLVLLKTCIVAASWVCVFLSMRDMPISLAAPIRATSPLWTLIGGIIIYSEIPSWGQAVGMVCIFLGYYCFSVFGKTEGFKWNSKGMVLILAGTIIGSISALYDKFLLNKLAIERNMLQFYFAVDMIPILALIAFFTRGHEKFTWRWSILVFGVMVILADWFYFYALSCPGAKISILSLMRRSNVIISFTLGYFLFKDRNFTKKALALILILTGTAILVFCK